MDIQTKTKLKTVRVKHVIAVTGKTKKVLLVSLPFIETKTMNHMKIQYITYITLIQHNTHTVISRLEKKNTVEIETQRLQI